jgi:hypothetical protein
MLYILSFVKIGPDFQLKIIFVSAMDDYDDREIGGMMIGRGNSSTHRKPALMPLCPPQIPHACRDENRGCRGGKPATNRLSYGTASIHRYKSTGDLYLSLGLKKNDFFFVSLCDTCVRMEGNLSN